MGRQQFALARSLPAQALPPGAARGKVLGTVLLLLTVLASPLALAEELTDLVRARMYVMLRDTRQEIEKSYYDPAFKGVDLATGAETAKARIAKAGTLGEALGAIAQFVLDLDDSHTMFLPPAQTVDVDYGWEMAIVDDACYVTHVSAGSDAAHQGVAPGDRITTVNGFRPSRETLWRIRYIFQQLRPQPGLHVELVTPAGAARELDVAARVTRRKAVVDLTGGNDQDSARGRESYYKAQDLAIPLSLDLGPDVFLMRYRIFSYDSEPLLRAIHKARDHGVLILDLRGNRGGLQKTLEALIGALSSADTSYVSSQDRLGEHANVAKGSGKGAFGGRLLVLVDAQSASASELLARVVQLTHRGTVIGDRTAGAVMLSQRKGLLVGGGENVIAYGVSVTVADLVMADGGHLEKVGVEPDIKLVPSPEDMAAGRDPVLAQALAMAGHTMDAVAAGKLLQETR